MTLVVASLAKLFELAAKSSAPDMMKLADALL
jgi:hypothetical protein